MLVREKDALPFELKGHFVATGTPESTGQGTYDEIWLSPEKWRKEINFGAFHLVLVHKENITYQLTPDDYEPAAVIDLQNEVLPTISFTTQKLNGKDLEMGTTKLGKIETVRIGYGEHKGNKINLPDNAAYFLASDGNLFLRTRDFTVTTYTRGGMLAGKFALLDFNETQGNEKFLDFKTDSLVANPKTEDKIFDVPDGAKRVPFGGVVSVASGMMAAHALAAAQPHYPEDARARHVTGTVILAAIIDKEGNVRDLRVLTSPDSSLSAAAKDGVSKWRYSPTTFDGQPVEVNTQIRVNFEIGR